MSNGIPVRVSRATEGQRRPDVMACLQQDCHARPAGNGRLQGKARRASHRTLAPHCRARAGGFAPLKCDVAAGVDAWRGKCRRKRRNAVSSTCTDTCTGERVTRGRFSVRHIDGRATEKTSARSLIGHSRVQLQSTAPRRRRLGANCVHQSLQVPDHAALNSTIEILLLAAPLAAHATARAVPPGRRSTPMASWTSRKNFSARVSWSNARAPDQAAAAREASRRKAGQAPLDHALGV